MKILVVSDAVAEGLYGHGLIDRMRGVDLVLSCGDLPRGYLDFLQTTLNVPLYYVHGNHHPGRDSATDAAFDPEGARDLHGRVVEAAGLLLAGLEGCPRYHPGGRRQYTESQAAARLLPMGIRLMMKALRGRRLDVLVTHTPPRGVHDEADRCHRGFRSLRAFVALFRPRLVVHGHTCAPGPAARWTRLGASEVVHAAPYAVVEI